MGVAGGEGMLSEKRDMSFTSCMGIFLIEGGITPQISERKSYQSEPLREPLNISV